ncbi:unnamed protein product [Symbiodinium sp. CCMP2592]|nr:unnamed protein product [Symbiodinium sp. CCMP2592]
MPQKCRAFLEEELEDNAMEAAKEFIATKLRVEIADFRSRNVKVRIVESGTSIDGNSQSITGSGMFRASACELERSGVSLLDLPKAASSSSSSDDGVSSLAVTSVMQACGSGRSLSRSRPCEVPALGAAATRGRAPEPHTSTVAGAAGVAGPAAGARM